jgi:chitin synthase
MAGTIPGGMVTIDIMRWILVGSTLVYTIPIVTYVLLFKKPNILCEIILGAFSFLFYGPTYLIILNIYSLCRIDDISWGTKGLDSGASSQNSKLKDSWKLIKFVHVSKYVFWNIIVSVIILSLGSSYTPRFFITITVVVIMASSLSVKILIGVIYMIKYKMSNCLCCAGEESISIVENSRVYNLIDKYR